MALIRINFVNLFVNRVIWVRLLPLLDGFHRGADCLGISSVESVSFRTQILQVMVRGNQAFIEVLILINFDRSREHTGRIKKKTPSCSSFVSYETDVHQFVVFHAPHIMIALVGTTRSYKFDVIPSD